MNSPAAAALFINLFPIRLPENRVSHQPQQIMALTMRRTIIPARFASTFACACREILRHRWFVGSTLALSAFAFAWIVTQGSFHFGAREPFGDFYDYQAVSLLH